MSMKPCIQDGDTVEIVPILSQHLNCGDIVLVEKEGGALLVHRVVRKHQINGRIAYLIKSDNSSSIDGWFSQNNILGRVEFVERNRQRIRLTSAFQRLRAWVWVLLNPLVRYLLVSAGSHKLPVEDK